MAGGGDRELLAGHQADIFCKAVTASGNGDNVAVILRCLTHRFAQHKNVAA
jgi:hypothetical protein